MGPIVRNSGAMHACSYQENPKPLKHRGEGHFGRERPTKATRCCATANTSPLRHLCPWVEVIPV